MIAPGLMARGLVLEDPRRDVILVVQFSDLYAMVFVMSLTGVSGACPCKQRTARTRNRETSSYNSYRICGCETGHVRRVGKTRINGKGAEVYKKHIYKGYTT